MRRSALAGATLATTAVIMAMACGGGGNDQPAGAPMAASTAELPAVSEPVTPTGTVDSALTLPDGVYFGYIHSIDVVTAPPTITFDPGEFLVGDEAAAAAIEDGAVGEGDVPGDYYVRNPEDDTVVLSVAPGAEVTRVQCPAACEEGHPGELEGLAASFTPSFALDDPEHPGAGYRGPYSQYWITIEGGEIHALDEQYVP